MAQAHDRIEHPADTERLHLSDLPAWPELLLLGVAAASVLGLLYALDGVIEKRAEAIAASALVRGVPPAAPVAEPSAAQGSSAQPS